LGLLDSKVGNSICFLVLDEIDILVNKKGGNEILYDLTRLNENLDKCKTSLIGISNKLKFKENLDPRILSSLGEEHIVFPSYNASELRDILNNRAKIVFHEGVLKEDVIPLCAAFAAKEHGDARKALQLLRKAGELAERSQNKIISSKYVEKAQADLENDYIIEYVKGIQWRNPIHWPVFGPYVFLYLATIMFYWWPLGLISRPLWYAYAILFVISTVLNITSHR